MAATAGVSVVELQAEIERLGRELDQASSEKIQSAQLGLVLLEEKSALQQRYDELESIYETTRHELKITQEALMKLDTTQKVTTRSGIEQENALLNESAAMESSLTLQILELEGETKQLRHELERVVSERDRLLAESSELGVDKATREAERAALRAELREARQREQRLLVDIGDLEDENISLQKQVSALRSSQVEFEGLKHEVRQLREEAENARAAADETAALRRIAERQLAEALEALQAEREAKFAAKKELDAHLSREAAYNITNLAYSIRGMPEDSTEDEGEPGGSSSAELATAMGDHHADLFSEVHLHEISRLEKQLEQAHNENSQLSASMRAAQAQAESESACACVLRAGLTRACSRVTALHALHADCAPLEDEKVEGGISARAGRWLTWWRVSGGELEALGAALTELAAAADAPDASASASAHTRQQLAHLSDRLAEADVRCAALQADADLLRTLAGGAGRALSTAAPTLASAAETLAQIYHHVCAVNGTQPERLLLEHAGQATAGGAEGRSVDEEALALAAGSLEGLRAAGLVARSADTLLDQLTHLRAALDTALDSRNRHQPGLTKNDYSKYKGSYNPTKKIKEQNNAKLKIIDTRRKLQHLITHLKSIDKSGTSTKEEDVCSGRTVREITDYFENISKNEATNSLDSHKTSWDSKCTDYSKRNSISSLPKTGIPYSHIKRTVMTKKGINQRDVNLHSIWKDKILQAKGVHFKREVEAKKYDVLNSIRESVKSSFVTCVLMLQYVM